MNKPNTSIPACTVSPAIIHSPDLKLICEPDCIELFLNVDNGKDSKSPLYDQKSNFLLRHVKNNFISFKNKNVHKASPTLRRDAVKESGMKRTWGNDASTSKEIDNVDSDKSNASTSRKIANVDSDQSACKTADLRIDGKCIIDQKSIKKIVGLEEAVRDLEVDPPLTRKSRLMGKREGFRASDSVGKNSQAEVRKDFQNGWPRKEEITSEGKRSAESCTGSRNSELYKLLVKKNTSQYIYIRTRQLDEGA